MKIIGLQTVDSTNSWIAKNETSLPSPSFVYAHEQTAGRGQRGNIWESEPDMNITASVLFHPINFPAINQFFISEIIALSIIEFLKSSGIKAEIKWPNDIYVGDKKICGILVEHVVTGSMLLRTIAGFGINLNQTVFKSDAPNPVSVKILTGKDTDVVEAIKLLAHIIEKNLESVSDGNFDAVHERFLNNLWRGDGTFRKYQDKKSNEEIEAKIENIRHSGVLVLRTREGEIREYAFKEVEFVL